MFLLLMLISVFLLSLCFMFCLVLCRSWMYCLVPTFVRFFGGVILAQVGAVLSFFMVSLGGCFINCYAVGQVPECFDSFFQVALEHAQFFIPFV